MTAKGENVNYTDKHKQGKPPLLGFILRLNIKDGFYKCPSLAELQHVFVIFVFDLDFIHSRSKF